MDFHQRAGEAQCESAATAITVFEPPHKSGNLPGNKNKVLGKGDKNEKDEQTFYGFNCRCYNSGNAWVLYGW